MREELGHTGPEAWALEKVESPTWQSFQRPRHSSAAQENVALWAKWENTSFPFTEDIRLLEAILHVPNISGAVFRKQRF